jgi:hypothetical protein
MVAEHPLGVFAFVNPKAGVSKPSLFGSGLIESARILGLEIGVSVRVGPSTRLRVWIDWMVHIESLLHFNIQKTAKASFCTPRANS